MDYKEILTIIFEVVLVPLLAALTGVAVKWINSKANEIKAKTDNAYLQKYIGMLNETITSAVVAVNQTYVEALKDQDIFTPEAQKEAFNKVYQTVKNSLTEEAYIYLNEAIGDVDKYIINKIEESVNINKTATKVE